MPPTLAKPLVEFLIDEYAATMQKQNEGGQTPPFDIEAMLAPLANFRRFANDYLSANYIQQLLTNLDGNYGVQLANGRQFLVGTPLDEQKGTMQPSTHQAVTGAQTAEDMQQAGAIPLTGTPGLVPPHAVDFTKPAAAQDMAQGQPQVRYDQQHPAVS
jgi:hypothetical protein